MARLDVNWPRRFTGLGSEVTLLHSHDHLLNKEDADAAAIVQQQFTQAGIHLALDITIDHVEQDRNWENFEGSTATAP